MHSAQHYYTDPSLTYIVGGGLGIFLLFLLLCLFLCLKKKCPTFNISLGSFRNSLNNMAAAYSAAAGRSPPAVSVPAAALPQVDFSPAAANIQHLLTNTMAELIRLMLAPDMNVNAQPTAVPVTPASVPVTPALVPVTPTALNSTIHQNDIIDLTNCSYTTEIISRDSSNNSVRCIGIA
jgi:hypothetical protein